MAVIEFKVVSTKETEVVPGNVIINIDLTISYAEFLSITKNLEKPYLAKFERPDGSSFEHNVGFAKGGSSNSNARITMRNFPDEVPAGTMVTIDQ